MSVPHSSGAAHKGLLAAIDGLACGRSAVGVGYALYHYLAIGRSGDLHTGYGEVGARSHGLGCHIGVVNAAHGINVELECACPRANGLGEGGGACGRCGNYRTGNIEVA